MEAMRPAALDAFGGGYDGTSAPPTKHWVPVSGRLVRGGFCDGQGWRGRGLGRQPIPLGRAKQSCRVLILDSNAPRPLGSCWFLANRAREAGGKTLRLQATPDTAKPSRQDKLAQPKGGGSSGSGGGGEEEVWGFFSPAEFSASWDVPWGFGTVIFGSILWLVSFICVGLIVLPLTAGLLGFDLSDTAVMEKSEIILLNQVLETAIGIGTIALVIGKYELPDDVMTLSLKGPFEKPRGWAVWALWGILLAPVVVGVASNILDITGYDESGRGTVDVVAKVVDVEGTTFLAVFTVTGILAPLLEETVFRGFLLASLTKWLPTPVAVLISSAAFGACHLSPRDLPQLVCLGMVLGFSYVRSRNLLTPMIIHGTWNSTVLVILYALASQGISIEEVINGTYTGTEALLQSMLHP